MIKVSFYKRYIILDFLTIDLMKYEKWGGGGLCIFEIQFQVCLLEDNLEN